MPRRIRIGDIVEIPTARGLAYAQVSHKREDYGYLIRVLPGFHARRPTDFQTLIAQGERFVVFFPVGAVVHRKIFEIVGNEEVPDRSKPFPVFRSGAVDPDGRVHLWWLWDGTREWRIGKLDDRTRQLPILELWNDTLLIERIEQEWTPATDFSSQDPK